MGLKYFDLSEFDSPDLPGSGENMDENFLGKLDDARGIAGIPFQINSGYRTPQRNKNVGGKTDSSHLMGHAADIHCIDSRSRWLIINALLLVGFNRIGIGKTFIHVDDDPQKVENLIWTYDRK